MDWLAGGGEGGEWATQGSRTWGCGCDYGCCVSSEGFVNTSGSDVVEVMMYEGWLMVLGLVVVVVVLVVVCVVKG